MGLSTALEHQVSVVSCPCQALATPQSHSILHVAQSEIGAGATWLYAAKRRIQHLTYQTETHISTLALRRTTSKSWRGCRSREVFVKYDFRMTSIMFNTNNMTTCALLAATGLRVLFPESSAYEDRQASYWAANAPLRPTCIVQPRTTEEVSQVVKILAHADRPFALRSGGHTQWSGSNDVHNGVTIDLGQMTNVTYDAQSGLASVQPGPKWADVYFGLLEHEVCVTGGREGNVGVAGFLTGGGNSYYAGLHGFGCDNVANFEVVLASGEIIDANATSHRDLWTALKGGSGNFGIVTRFDMYTFPAHDLWGGIRVANRSEGDRLADLTVDFTNGNDKNPEAAFILNHNYNAASGPDILVAHVVIDTKGTANATAFDEILKVPVAVEDTSTRSMANMSASYNVPRHQQ